MITTHLPIYLASKSPRRQKLLKQIGLKFKVKAVETEEKLIKSEPPVQTVKRIAIEKLEAAKKEISKGIIITADTVVVIDGKIIGKPKDKKDAFKILKKLSGNTHFVFTGYCIYNSETKKSFTKYVRTAVKFREITKNEINDYIETGSPMDKAGAYGIQDDYGAVFIESIKGCYYNVVGLPISHFFETFKKVL